MFTTQWKALAALSLTINMFALRNVGYKNIIHIPELFIPQAKISVVTGPSGTGKTTLLKLLNKMLSPTAGTILFNGKDLKMVNPAAHRRDVIMLSQNPVMFAGTIRDNLNTGLKLQEKDIKDDNELTKILEKIRLNKPLETDAGVLSGGEKQRLAIGRVLLLQPHVYLMDEPSSALDDATEEEIIHMIAENVKKENKSLIMVTHSASIEKKYAEFSFKMEKNRM